jgi:hypothetical protein
LFGLSAIVLVGCALFFSHSSPREEPIVEGHPLGYWIDQFVDDGSSESPEAIQSALSAMDDHCMRALIDELNWTPSPLLILFDDWKRRLNRGAGANSESPYRQAGAALVLGHLGSRATKAIPVLENASRRRMRIPEQGQDIRGAAIAALILIRHYSLNICARKSLDVADPFSGDYRYAIYCLGTNAAPAIPVFTNAAEAATNFVVKFYATYSLTWIHRPDLTVPPLISMLKQTDSASRSVAAHALGGIREAAKPAWNDLVILLNDPDRDVRWNATNALWQIDPAAMQQLKLVQP